MASLEGKKIKDKQNENVGTGRQCVVDMKKSVFFKNELYSVVYTNED